MSINLTRFVIFLLKLDFAYGIISGALNGGLDVVTGESDQVPHNNMRVSGPNKRDMGRQRKPPISFALGSDEDLEIISRIEGRVNVSNGP